MDFYRKMKAIRCKQCGKKYFPKTLRSNFCSKKCYFKYWTDNHRDYVNKRMREYRAKRYKKNGKWLDEGIKARELKQWMNELKSQPCFDCGNKFPVCCMDFDHRIDVKKNYNIGEMFAHHYSKKLIEKELKKCDLVCSNCHRIRTRDKRVGSGNIKILK